MLKKLKNIARNLILKKFEEHGYSVRFRCLGIDFPSILRETALRAGKDFFFLQIGGLDGQSDDPIHEFITNNPCRGVVVEPQSNYFEQLKKNYRQLPDICIDKVLVSSDNAIHKFYRLSSECPAKYHGLASFDRELILKHLDHEPDAESWIVTETLPTLSLNNLLAKHQITRLDLLQIDTEGFDFDIIKQIDFERLRPNLIHFEHIHLAPEKLRACIDLLKSKGYLLLVEEMDITAFPRFW
jgi:FkbM family methyltransferase